MTPMRLGPVGAIGLLSVFVLFASCSALTWTIRAGYSTTGVPIDDTAGWRVLQGGSCLEKSTTSWRFLLTGASSSNFTNNDMTGFNESDTSGSLPYRNRLPLHCATPTPTSNTPILGNSCTSPPPFPPSAFVCNLGSNSYVPALCASDRCVIDSSVVLNGTSITILQNTTINGSVNGSTLVSQITIKIPSSGSVPTFNVLNCLASDIPIFVDISSLPAAPQNGTVLEYSTCSGSAPPVQFTGQQWNDCEKGYSRRFNPTTNGDRVSISLVFTPVDATSCQNGLSTSISTAAIIGAAVGGTVALVVLVLLIIFLIPSARAKVFPYAFSRRRKQAQSIELDDH